MLEPKVNLYDEFVLLLDFNSLYPSLIQEYNLCFSTVQRPRGDRINNMTEQELLAATEAPKSVDAKNEGILPRVVRRLVGNRKTVKTELKKTVDPSKKAALEIKQKALKLVANSLYGTLGFSHSRFHVRSIAALITQRGRAALGETQQLIEQLHYEVGRRGGLWEGIRLCVFGDRQNTTSDPLGSLELLFTNLRRCSQGTTTWVQLQYFPTRKERKDLVLCDLILFLMSLTGRLR